MFLLFAVIVGGGVRAESSTCDPSYGNDNGDACAYYSFGCYMELPQQEIPTCFNGLAQSPINLDSDSATVVDPGQLTFSGYNDQLPQTPMLRLKDFTVQLDFKETLAISYPTIRSNIQPTVKRGEQKLKHKKKKKKNQKKKKTKRKKKRKQKGKRDNRRRVGRNVSVPSITGGALGNET